MIYPAMCLLKAVTAFNPQLNLVPIITLLYSAINLIVQKCTWNHKCLCSHTGTMNVVEQKGRYEVPPLPLSLPPSLSLSLSHTHTAVLVKIQVFWDVTLFCWVSGSGCFEGLQFLHLQDPAVQELLHPFSFHFISFHIPLILYRCGNSRVQAVQLKSGLLTKPWIFHIRCYL